MLIVKHIGARLHRFIYGFFRSSDHAEALALHKRVCHLLKSNNVATRDQRDRLVGKIAGDVAETLQLASYGQSAVEDFVARLIDYEGLFLRPDVDFSEPRTTSQYWQLKDELNQQKDLLTKFPTVIDAITSLALTTFGAVEQSIGEAPSMTDDDGDGIAVKTRRIDRIANLPETVECIIAAPFDDAHDPINPFARLRQRLETNLVVASGGNPRDLSSFNRSFKTPTTASWTKPEELVGAYLGGTPLSNLFDGEETFVIPQSARFEHHHIVAGTGHGKTQTLQYLIAEDLKAVERGERSIVIIDSQGDLIKTIRQLQCFAPDEPLHDRICIIDPADIEYPVSLNLFDVGQERLAGYKPLERERLTNSILELYDFVLGSLLSAEMTQKQSVLFRYVTRLMLHIPDATIHTLAELMEKGSEVKFAEHIAKLGKTAQRFFATEFSDKEFAATRRQVMRRLWGILENQTFERMFSHPRSKLDLFAEMNAGKVILINTAKELLKENGTQIFGRFFIAMIAQAAQERAVLPKTKRMPTIVYVDEAADYFDHNIGIILSQARKYNVGMVLAHQYLGQLDSKLQEAFAANTSIKFAGGVSNRDARALAQNMACETSLIETQQKGAYAAHIRGVTKSAIPLQFEAFRLENMPIMSDEEQTELRQMMRDKYAVHYTELDGSEGNEDGSSNDEPPDGDQPKPNGGSNGGKPDGDSGQGGQQTPDDPDNPDIGPTPQY